MSDDLSRRPRVSGAAAGRGRTRVTVRRVYEDPAGPGGYRVLVDRLWPRGMAKDRLELDRWAREVAPSTDLRRWYGHDPERFGEFRRRYLAELSRPPAADAVEEIRAAAGRSPLVLLTATRDVERSGASVLADHLAAGPGKGARGGPGGGEGRRSAGADPHGRKGAGR